MKVHGLLLLDKPKGLSSNAALQKARRLLDADKAGHGGTLDPMADGLLPVMFGEACKLAESALQGDKTYEATLRLGQVTTTDDTEGEVVATAPVEFTDADLDAVLVRFRGSIEQVPPIYSALKLAGKPLYRYAREGAAVQAAARRVDIHELRLLDRLGGDEPSLSIRVACSKGTYIRSLARDIGAALGCGAHLTALRRTRVGRFDVGAAVGLEALAALSAEDRSLRLVGLEQLVSDWPSVVLDPESAAQFRQGQVVSVAAGKNTFAAAARPGSGSTGSARSAASTGSSNSIGSTNTGITNISIFGDGHEASPKIAVHCGGRLIGLGRSTLTTESTCALAPVRIIVS